ncbi:MAG: hypothetical protein ACM3WP_22780 [Acidobacteriota bacterium]
MKIQCATMWVCDSAQVADILALAALSHAPSVHQSRTQNGPIGQIMSQPRWRDLTLTYPTFPDTLTREPFF